LIDATDPFGNGHLLPRGPLRESAGQLARADASILTRFSTNGSGDRILGFLKEEFPGIPVFCADHLPDSIVFPHSDEVRKPALLKGRRVAAFAGIARPEAFRNTLIRLGADIVSFRGFKDHYQFRQDDIRELIQMKERSGAQYLLTTEKDWIRMASLSPVCPDLAYLCVKFAILPGQKEDFFRIIKACIGQG
ncbi:MAG: tetraacyldisaccharide 4'-kinase, partial [Thermodesulfobacteriota bacterium]|nr:tetraacyldisaccharide 4'-kinase [Thermodesulfobacteriota bacterium]